MAPDPNSYSNVADGDSRSFPDGDPFMAHAADGDADVVVCLGRPAKDDIEKLLADAEHRKAVLIELGRECLAMRIGEDSRHPNVLGFARYRIGDAEPSPLVELVRQPASAADAVEVATRLFTQAGLSVAVCADQVGRIIDRLVRPKYNAALRLLDEGLATDAAMDLTCRLGLGYPEGPIERVRRGGLSEHYRISRDLFEVYGSAAYAPARSAVVAAKREEPGP
jgi:3-hydroxybutyryl-CoA dehydrogenase